MIRTQKITMASRVVILSRLNTLAAPLTRGSSPCPLQLSRQGSVDVPVDQVRREHREDGERYGDHYQAAPLILMGSGRMRRLSQMSIPE